MAKRGERITKQGDVPFASVHPIPGRKTSFKGKNLPAWAGLDGCESKYRRCIQCGYILDSDKTSPGSGYGNEQAVLKTGYTDRYDDVLSTSGCPFCAASNF